MSTTTLNATAAYYHLTPLGGDACTSWIAGGPRKGTIDGQRAIGMVLFDKAAAKSAIGNDNVPAMNITLNRDTSYGTGTVDIALAPIYANVATNDMTYEQCLSLIDRGSHYVTTVSGNSTTIPLPGYWLQRTRMNGIAGVMIYQEDGEGTSNEARFTPMASIEITIGTEWKQPVWSRPIGTGDIISGPARSFKADMLEIMEYINIRRECHGLAWIGYSGLSNTAYADWPAATLVFQNGIDGIYTQEEKTAIVWKRAGSTAYPDSPSNIILPNAEIINQMRNALEAPISNTDTTETLEVSLYARTFFDNLNSDFTVNKEALTTWDAEGPWSGMNWEYVMDNGEKKKKYTRRFGFWLINNITAGKTINKAKIRLTRNKGANGSQTINLYPVKISSLPATKMKVNDVMDTRVIVGTAQAAIGETVEIELSDAFRTALGTTYYGVGVDDHQQWTNYGASATLIINYT